ncbi:Zinc finger, GRF-type [Sesbania bispinosa]|nr:Zinc finger, GRF-type [Sesbania bispinosa]
MKRCSASKSSSSSSIYRRMVCACGDELLIMKLKSARNPGRMFWRCHNWDEMTCNFFRWVDDDATEQGVITDERQLLEHEREELKRKIVKLQMRLKWGKEESDCGSMVFDSLYGANLYGLCLAMVKCD